MSVWSYVMKVTNRKRIIMDRVNNEPYLERYYIFFKDRPEYFPFNIFIHKFLKSDPDEINDHPWGFFKVPPHLRDLGENPLSKIPFFCTYYFLARK